MGIKHLSIQLETFDEKSISVFRGRIVKAYQLTDGVQFNQWKVLVVFQGSINRTRTIAVVPEIITLISLADIYICFQIVCVCFSSVQHPNSWTIRWNATPKWIPLVKLDATGQMLCPEDFGPCLGIEAYSITKSILERHFTPETFISIDNNLQRRVSLHNMDRLSHESEEILVFLFSFFFFHVIPVSVLSVFVATAYSILRFTAKTEIKYKLTLNLVTLSAVCLFIHVNWSTETGQMDFL